MPTFAKRFLIVAVILTVVLAVALLCVNVYLQSAGVQQRIRSAAAKSLGTKINIRSTIYTPWDGLVLRGLSIPDPLAANENIVEAAALRVRFAFWPLVQQRFVITDLSLHDPHMIVRQLPEGDWLVPVPPETPLPSSTQEEPGRKVSGPSFKSEIRRFRLLGGHVVFLDAKNRRVMVLEKADIDAKITDNRTATGTFDIGNADISGLLKPRKVGGSFVWDGSSLNLPDLTGSLANGKITGSCLFDVKDTSKPSFALSIKLQESRFKKVAEEAGFDPETAEGTLNGWFDLKGDPRTSDSLEGKGHLELIDGTIRPVDFLIQLGTTLEIEELQLLKLSDAKMDFSVGNERVRVDNLILKSENLILTGKGPVKFTGKLDLDARLLVNQKLQQQFGGLLGKNFTASPDYPEYRQVEFNVTGKLSSPKTDLLDKIIGIKIGQDIGGLLNNLFRQAAPEQKTNSSGN